MSFRGIIGTTIKRNGVLLGKSQKKPLEDYTDAFFALTDEEDNVLEKRIEESLKEFPDLRVEVSYDDMRMELNVLVRSSDKGIIGAWLHPMDIVIAGDKYTFTFNPVNRYIGTSSESDSEGGRRRRRSTRRRSTRRRSTRRRSTRRH